MGRQTIPRGNLFRLFLIEDNPADVRLTEEALNELKRPYDLRVANNGVQALEYLRGSYSTGARPDLILLDWNLPGMDGREVLRLIKEDQRLRKIPVVVLTTSDAASDVARAYDLHANCFITKPGDVTQFFDMISAVEEFWLKRVKLPVV